MATATITTYPEAREGSQPVHVVTLGRRTAILDGATFEQMVDTIGGRVIMGPDIRGAFAVVGITPEEIQALVEALDEAGAPE
jgi:hypothetical protein